MRNLMILALCLLALPVKAANQASLWGTWNVTSRADRTFKGMLVIDRAGRAMWDTSWDPEFRRRNNIAHPGTGRAKSFGYVEAKPDGTFDLVLTDRDAVQRTHCVPQSAELVLCFDGWTVLSRMAPGPDNLITPSR